MKKFENAYQLKKEIQSTFPNKIVKSINEINLINRVDLCDFKVSNKYVIITTYTPFLGKKIKIINPPFQIEFL